MRERSPCPCQPLPEGAQPLPLGFFQIFKSWTRHHVLPYKVALRLVFRFLVTLEGFASFFVTSLISSFTFLTEERFC